MMSLSKCNGENQLLTIAGYRFSHDASKNVVRNKTYFTVIVNLFEWKYNI